MGKKHKHPEHENLERWLVSYADFITLLFATFVVLYALSQADLAKFKQAGESIKAAFNPNKNILKDAGGVMKGDPDPHILKDSGDSILDRVNPKPAPMPPTESGTVSPVTEAVKRINQQIKEIQKAQGKGGSGSGSGGGGEDPQASLKIQERGIVISFSSNLFFEPGSAGIKPSSFPILDKVAKELISTDRIVHVEGHTDSQPIFTAIYPSNWELSTARASSVVRYFIARHQFPAGRLAAVGYGSTRPLANNKSPEGRAKNRRVDIVILFSNAAPMADAGPAQHNEKVIFSAESEAKPVAKPSSKAGSQSTSKTDSKSSSKAKGAEAEEALPARLGNEKAKMVDIKPKSINILEKKRRDD